MKWLLTWTEENENGDRLEHEHWATSWEEAVGHYTSWLSKSSDAIKGDVICYWDDTPYSNGNPCMTYNICTSEMEDDE